MDIPAFLDFSSIRNKNRIACHFPPRVLASFPDLESVRERDRLKEEDKMAAAPQPKSAVNDGDWICSEKS